MGTPMSRMIFKIDAEEYVFQGIKKPSEIKVGSVTDRGYKVESIEKSGNIFKAILSGVKNPQKIISVKVNS